jgi:hypothetical protein
MIVKVTPKDENLPHQIVLLASANAGRVDISCNCLRLTSHGGHKSMGSIKYGDEEGMWAIYDDLRHHTNHGERPAFVPGDRGTKEFAIVW